MIGDRGVVSDTPHPSESDEFAAVDNCPRCRVSPCYCDTIVEPFEELSPPYSTIVADPPWHYDGRFVGGWGNPAVAPMPYSTMTVDEIAGLPVGALAAPGAHLYLWTTQKYVWDARSVAAAWGFTTLKLLTWCKQPVGHGPGGAFANTTEFIVFARHAVGPAIRAARMAAGMTQDALERATRGRATRLSKRWEDGDCFPTAEDWKALGSILGLPPGLVADPVSHPTTWWNWPRGAHSAKPAAFLDMVEQVSPGPYVELFARAPRLGWDSWGYGYEIGETA